MRGGYVLAILTALSICLYGCGEKMTEWVGPYPTVESLMAEGWAAHDSAQYDTAFAKFSQVVEIQADYPEAYVGLGWSGMELGKFAQAHSYFSLAVTLSGERPALAVFDEDSPWDTAGGDWIVRPENTPICGVSEVYNKSKDEVYTIENFTDSLIEISGDSLPDTSDVLEVDYHYLQTGAVWADSITPHSYAGDAGAFAAENELVSAIVAANALLKLKEDEYQFDHSPYTASRDVQVLLCQCYYNSFLFLNAYWEVRKLDPNYWVPSDTSHTAQEIYPDDYLDLLEKIQELEEGG